MTDTADDMDLRLSRLAEGGADVVILGAGVNGAGLFRDLCLQGVNCLIVDKADFGSGTSAAPTAWRWRISPASGGQCATPCG